MSRMIVFRSGMLLIEPDKSTSFAFAIIKLIAASLRRKQFMSVAYVSDEWEAPSWSNSAGVVEGDKGSGSSKRSKPESVSWSSSAGAIKDGYGSGSSKSTKLLRSLPAGPMAWVAPRVPTSVAPRVPSQSQSWSSGSDAIEDGNCSGSSKSSKPATNSASWSGGTSDIKEGFSSGSSKSSKLAGDSDEWESAKWSGGGLIKGGKGSGSSKSSKPAGGSGDALDEKRSTPETISDGESGRWSGGAAV